VVAEARRRRRPTPFAVGAFLAPGRPSSPPPADPHLFSPAADYPHAAGVRLTLTPTDGAHPPVHAWATVGGAFAFHAPPAGPAALDASAPGLLFPRIALEVPAAESAPLRAWYADAPGAGELPTSPGLRLRAAGRAEHYESTPPFNVVAFLKTPYGMLLAFVVFAVFALPRMKIDPDELEELMGSRRAAEGGGGDAPAPALPDGRPPTGSARRRQVAAAAGAGGLD
jgi:hypothetical protein